MKRFAVFRFDADPQVEDWVFDRFVFGEAEAKAVSAGNTISVGPDHGQHFVALAEPWTDEIKELIPSDQLAA